MPQVVAPSARLPGVKDAPNRQARAAPRSVPTRGGCWGLYGLSEYEAKNAIALEKLKTEFKGKVEILPLPPAVLRELKKMASDVVKEESEKSPMARKVYASFTRFQAQLVGWSRISEGAYQQFVAL